MWRSSLSQNTKYNYSFYSYHQLCHISDTDDFQEAVISFIVFTCVLSYQNLIKRQKKRSCSHSKNKNSQHRLLTGQLYAMCLCCNYKTLSCGRLLSHNMLIMPDIDNNNPKNHHLILIMSSVVTNAMRTAQIQP